MVPKKLSCFVDDIYEQRVELTDATVYEVRCTRRKGLVGVELDPVQPRRPLQRTVARFPHADEVPQAQVAAWWVVRCWHRSSGTLDPVAS
jgi:hypothetical protein